MSILPKLLEINQMPDDESHMTMNSENQLIELLLSSIIIVGLVILVIIAVFFIYFYKKYKIVPVLDSVSVNSHYELNKEDSNSETVNTGLNFKKINISDSKNTSFSINEQFYQKKQIMKILSNFPNGVVQSKIPSLTNLSKATISRRLNELFEDDIIEKIPSGRSNLINLKSN